MYLHSDSSYYVKKIKRLKIIDICTIVFVGYMISGYTAANSLYIGFTLFAFWLIFALLSDSASFIKSISDKKYMLAVFVLLYAFFMGVFAGDMFYLIKQVGNGLMTFSPIIIFSYYGNDAYQYRRKKVLWAVLIIWVYYMIKAYNFYLVNESAARTLARDRTAFGDIALGGGYLIAYGSAMLACLCIGLVLESRLKSKMAVIVCILLFVMTALLLVKVQSTITLVALIIGTAAALLFKASPKLTQQKTNHSNLVIKIVIFIIFLLIAALGAKYLGKSLIDYSASVHGAFGRRLNSIGYILTGDLNSGEYGINRAAITLKALKTFVFNPLIGVCFKHGNGYLKTASFGLGDHCEFVDALANYGIIGGIPFLSIYFIQVWNLINTRCIPTMGWIVCFLVLGIFNPFRSFQTHLVLFYVIPTISQILQSANKVDNNRQEVQASIVRNKECL